MRQKGIVAETGKRTISGAFAASSVKLFQRFAASQSHFAYRLVLLECYRIRPVPEITDFDRAASEYPKYACG